MDFDHIPRQLDLKVVIDDFFHRYPAKRAIGYRHTFHRLFGYNLSSVRLAVGRLVFWRNSGTVLDFYCTVTAPRRTTSLFQYWSNPNSHSGKRRSATLTHTRTHTPTYTHPSPDTHTAKGNHFRVHGYHLKYANNRRAPEFIPDPSWSPLMMMN